MVQHGSFVCACPVKALDLNLHRSEQVDILQETLAAVRLEERRTVFLAGGGCVGDARVALVTVNHLIVAFTGKLENYPTLVREHDFELSDEEVTYRKPEKVADLIGHLYLKLGKDMVTLLRGDHSYVIYDSKQVRVLAVRSKTSTQPLLQAYTSKKVLLISTGSWDKPETFQHLPAPLEGVQDIPPCHFKYGWRAIPHRFASPPQAPGRTSKVEILATSREPHGEDDGSSEAILIRKTRRGKRAGRNQAQRASSFDAARRGSFDADAGMLALVERRGSFDSRHVHHMGSVPRSPCGPRRHSVDLSSASGTFNAQKLEAGPGGMSWWRSSDTSDADSSSVDLGPRTSSVASLSARTGPPTTPEGPRAQRAPPLPSTPERGVAPWAQRSPFEPLGDARSLFQTEGKLLYPQAVEAAQSVPAQAGPRSGGFPSARSYDYSRKSWAATPTSRTAAVAFATPPPGRADGAWGDATMDWQRPAAAGPGPARGPHGTHQRASTSEHHVGRQRNSAHGRGEQKTDGIATHAGHSRRSGHASGEPGFAGAKHVPPSSSSVSASAPTGWGDSGVPLVAGGGYAPLESWEDAVDPLQGPCGGGPSGPETRGPALPELAAHGQAGGQAEAKKAAPAGLGGPPAPAVSPGTGGTVPQAFSPGTATRVGNKPPSSPQASSASAQAQDPPGTAPPAAGRAGPQAHPRAPAPLPGHNDPQLPPRVPPSGELQGSSPRSPAGLGPSGTPLPVVGFSVAQLPYAAELGLGKDLGDSPRPAEGSLSARLQSRNPSADSEAGDSSAFGRSPVPLQSGLRRSMLSASLADLQRVGEDEADGTSPRGDSDTDITGTSPLGSARHLRVRVPVPRGRRATSHLNLGALASAQPDSQQGAEQSRDPAAPVATEGPIPVPGGTEASAAPELSQSKPEALHEVLATLPSEMLQKLAGPYRDDAGSARMLANLLYSSPCALVVADATQPDHPIVYVNSMFELKTGYSAPEVLGKNCRFLQAPPGMPRAASLASVAICRALASGKSISTRLLNYDKKGHAMWTDLSIVPIRNGDGQVTHYIGMQSFTPVDAHPAAPDAAGPVSQTTGFGRARSCTDVSKLGRVPVARALPSEGMGSPRS